MNAWQAGYLATSLMVLLFALTIPTMLVKEQQPMKFERKNRTRR